MAKNPMQRKARNSFILGMFITLIITGSIIGLLVFKLININKENKEKAREYLHKSEKEMLLFL